jgi:hypothetical protein
MDTAEMKKKSISHFLIRNFGWFWMTLLPFVALAQTNPPMEKTLSWNRAGLVPDSLYLPFEEAFSKEQLPIPVHVMHHFEGRRGYQLRAEIQIEKYSPAQHYTLEGWLEILPENMELLVENFGKNQPSAKVSFVPYFKKDNQLQKIERYKILYEWVRSAGESDRGPFVFKNKSVLSDGEIYKLAIPENGVYAITESFIRNTLNLNPGNISPKNIKIYSTGRGINPTNFRDMEVDDLEEIPLLFEGNQNNSFEANEKIYFYARGHHEFVYEENNLQWTRKTNIYDNQAYVFLKIGSGRTQNSPPTFHRAAARICDF